MQTPQVRLPWLVACVGVTAAVVLGCSTEQADRVMRETRPLPEVGTTFIDGQAVVFVSTCDREVSDVAVSGVLQNTDAERTPDTQVTPFVALERDPAEDLDGAKAFVLDEQFRAAPLPDPYDYRLVLLHLNVESGGLDYLTLPLADIPEYPEMLTADEPERVTEDVSTFRRCG